MKITKLEKYDPKAAHQIRQLLIQLSRSGRDRGDIPKEWFDELIASPYHDMLIATNDDGDIIGIATLSVHMGPIIRKNAYLEDFVTDSTVRGQGVGSALWEEMLKWAREKGCNNLEFTCGDDRGPSHRFYKNHGASIYDTNFFRRSI